MGPFVYVLLGSCKDITVGPTSIMAIMTAEHVKQGGVDLAVLLTFFAGLLQLVLGLLNFGFLVNLIAQPVICGFTSAAALTIFVAQLRLFFGIKKQTGNHVPSTGSAFLDDILALFYNYRSINVTDTVLGLCTFTTLVLLKVYSMRRAKRKRQRVKIDSDQTDQTPVLPKNRDQDVQSRLDALDYLLLSRNAIIVVVTTLIAYIATSIHFTLTQEIKAGLPTFTVPNFSSIDPATNATVPFSTNMARITPGFVSVALLSLLESVAVAKTFTSTQVHAGTANKLDATQEMLSLGTINLFGAFFRAFPVSGSFTRSIINNASGVRTTFSGIFAGSVVLIALSPRISAAFHYIPQTVLASIVMASVIFSVHPGDIRTIYNTNKIELFPFFVTVFTSVAIGLDYGLLLGCLASICLLLHAISRPLFVFDVRSTANGAIQYLFVMPNQSIMYPSVEYFSVKIQKNLSRLGDMNLNLMSDSEPRKLVVIDGTYLFKADVTFCLSVCKLVEEMAARNVMMLFCKCRGAVRQAMQLASDGKVKLHFVAHENDLSLVLLNTDKVGLRAV